MLITLYQITDLNSPMAFRKWEDSIIDSLDLSNYKQVYRFWYKTKPPKDSDCYDSALDTRDEMMILRVIQGKFYPSIPADCRGHALSSSDIVTIDDNGESLAYYYSKGEWIDITEVLPRCELG